MAHALARLDRRLLTPVGGFIASLGLLASCARMTGIDARVLAWVDARGAGAGWGIRLAFVLIGGALYAAGKAGRAAPDVEKQATAAAEAK